MAVLYRHIRLDKNEPFYIGIGKNIKRAYTIFHRNSIWNKIVKKSPYEVEILLDSLTMEEAKKKEKEFIKLYGRIQNGGILANLTDGGDGTSGYRLSDSTKNKISEKQKNRFLDKSKHPMFGKKQSIESKIKNSESNKGSNSYLYGKKGALHPRYKKSISDIHKNAIINSNKKRTKVNLKNIMYEVEKYGVKEIANKYKVSISTIYRNIKRKKNEIHNGG